MKRILFILSVLISGFAYGQTTGYFRYDTITFQKVGGNSEFKLLNATRNVIGGVLTNTGGGRTSFITPGSSLDTSNHWVNRIAKNAAGDSIIYWVGTTRFAVYYPGTGSGGSITNVTATSPITSSGGTTPNISTSMATESLIYRKTAGTGVMEVNTLATLKTDLLLTGTNSGDQTTTGTTNRISVTGGTTNPVVDISSSYVGQASITTLGTITTGTWNGSTIGIGYGGTNISTYATGDILYGSASNVLSKRAIGTTGQVLTVTGGVPVWGDPLSTLTANNGLTKNTSTNVQLGGTLIANTSIPISTFSLALGKTTFLTNPSNRNFAAPANNQGTVTVDARDLTEIGIATKMFDWGAVTNDIYNFYDSAAYAITTGGAVTGYIGESAGLHVGVQNSNENIVLQLLTGPRRSVYADSGSVIMTNGRNLDFGLYGANNGNIRFGHWANGMNPEWARFDYRGYLGLNTILPTHQLTVNGQVRINAIGNVGTPDSTLYIENGVLVAGLTTAGGLGTVTSVDLAYGITGSSDPITTTGTVIADTTILVNKAGAQVISGIKNFTGTPTLNGAAIPSISSTSTLTNKTLTSPQINGAKLETSSTVGYVWTATNTAGAGGWAAATGLGSFYYDGTLRAINDSTIGGDTTRFWGKLATKYYTDSLRTTQGLQNVITNNPALTANNTVRGKPYTFAFDTLKQFSVRIYGTEPNSGHPYKMENRFYMGLDANDGVGMASQFFDSTDKTNTLVTNTIIATANFAAIQSLKTSNNHSTQIYTTPDSIVVIGAKLSSHANDSMMVRSSSGKLGVRVIPTGGGSSLTAGYGILLPSTAIILDTTIAVNKAGAQVISGAKNFTGIATLLTPVINGLTTPLNLFSPQFGNGVIRSQQTTGLPPSVPLPSVIQVATSAVYNAWPSLVKDNRGRLQVFYSSGSSHLSTDNVLKRAVSGDGGISWTTNTITTPLDYLTEVKALLMSNGNIGLAISTTTIAGTTWNVYFMYSSDNGQTWSTPVIIKSIYPSSVGPNCSGFSEDKGTLYVTFYGFIGGSDTRFSAQLSKSTDGGLTWSSPITVATAPTTNSYNEFRIVRYKDSLVAFIRDENPINKLWRSASIDGTTWGTPVDVTPSGYTSSQPDPIVVGNMLHFTYRSGSGGSAGMSRGVSYDGGLSWNATEVVETSGFWGGYEVSKTIYDNGLLITAYGMDQVSAGNNSEIKILTYRWGAAAGLDGDISVEDQAYNATSWNGSFEVPTKNAVRDKIESLGGGSGTVTSVGFTGGLISVATATTTPAFTVAGTSGGIPYFSSASTWASSAALAANALVIGGGAGAAPATTTTGTGVLTALGVNVGSAGAFVTFNGTLGTPTSGTVTNLTGTASININGTVGATTAAAGTFTTAIANSFVPNLSTVPSNGLYLPAANTMGWAINSAAELQLTATALSPAADGGNSFGTTALGWQNLFANTGFVLNIENSDWVATHTAGILTVGTGDLRVTTAGTNTASVVTIGGTQTLTNKTLTSPVLTTPNIGAATATSIAISGQISSTQVTLTDGATVTWSWTGGTNAVVTLGGNRTLSITNAVAGTYATLKVIQDGTGSRTLALPGSGASKVVNGGAGVITLTTTAAAVDIITVYYDGTNYFFSYGRNYN